MSKILCNFFQLFVMRNVCGDYSAVFNGAMHNCSKKQQWWKEAKNEQRCNTFADY